MSHFSLIACECSISFSVFLPFGRSSLSSVAILLLFVHSRRSPSCCGVSVVGTDGTELGRPHGSVGELGQTLIKARWLFRPTPAAALFAHPFETIETSRLKGVIRAFKLKEPVLSASFAGKARPQLVLLDHGLYRSLDNNLRSNYAALWKVSGPTYHQFISMVRSLHGCSPAKDGGTMWAPLSWECGSVSLFCV